MYQGLGEGRESCIGCGEKGKVMESLGDGRWV
jgi:hypothetical protein